MTLERRGQTAYASPVCTVVTEKVRLGKPETGNPTSFKTQADEKQKQMRTEKKPTTFREYKLIKEIYMIRRIFFLLYQSSLGKTRAVSTSSTSSAVLIFC